MYYVGMLITGEKKPKWVAHYIQPTTAIAHAFALMLSDANVNTIIRYCPNAEEAPELTT